MNVQEVQLRVSYLTWQNLGWKKSASAAETSMTVYLTEYFTEYLKPK